MTSRAALARMSEAKLRGWLLARMRGTHEDPPIDESRLETPADFVQQLHRETDDAAFRARIEKVTVDALREVGHRNLRRGCDARAAHFLAVLADGIELRAAAPVLQEIAERGAFGGHDGTIDPEAENLVLFALAGQQEPRVLYRKWLALWQRGPERLWPVASTGLRMSDPVKALAILPEAVTRAAKSPGFPLGEVLWVFIHDQLLEAKQVSAVLGRLDAEGRRRARAALAQVGAEPDELAAWVPDPPTNAVAPKPAWASRPGLVLTEPPRVSKYAEAA